MGAHRDLVFGLVGESLGHSHSPAIHELLGSVPYDLVEVGREHVGDLFASRRYSGLNVTIPYKKVAFAAADALTDTARRLGNVNTLVVRPDGTIAGDNTDYHGFARELASTGVDIRGRSCLVLGDGGAAATVRTVLADAGAREVVTATRRGGAAPAVTDAAGRRVPSSHIMLSQLEEAKGEGAAVRGRAEVVVNATPVGTYPHADDEPLVDLALFPKLACVCDLVYNPLATRLVQRARELGVPATGGLLMLVAQAKRSSDLFLGVERPDGIEEEVHAALLARLSCVSLIGMPGSGKTSVGRRLADILGYAFVDVDDLVAERAGMDIPQIFRERGEEGFRALETACTAEALARPGHVVACGGGVVTRERNLPLLHQNGPVVLLTRGLDASDGVELSAEGRPLSQSVGVGRLRVQREPLYRAWADIAVAPAGEDPLETARRAADAVRAWFGRQSACGAAHGACQG